MKQPFKSKTGGTDPLQVADGVLKNQSRTLGRSLGMKGLPKEGDQLDPYIRSIRSGYQNLLTSQVAGLVTTGAGKLKERIVMGFEEKRQRLTKTLDEGREKLRKFELIKGEIPDSNYKTIRVWPYHLLIFCTALLEALFSRPAFAMFAHSSNLAQMGILIGLVALFIFIPSGIVWMFRATEEVPYKVWIWAAVFALLFAGFYVLGILRSSYLQNIGSSTLQEIHVASTLTIRPIFFTVMSLLFIAVGVYAAWILPSPEQNETNHKARELDTKITALEVTINRTEEELNMIPTQQMNAELKDEQNVTKAQNIAMQINSMFLAAAAEFISENTLHRTGARPSCMDDPIDDLNMNI